MLMPKKLYEKVFLTFFAVLLVVPISASYYKYVVLGAYETLFYIECSEDEEGCFSTLAYCEEGQSEEECSYIYKVYVVEQNTIDSMCQVDEGECLEQICSDGESCKTLYCTDSSASKYGILDECSS